MHGVGKLWCTPVVICSLVLSGCVEDPEPAELIHQQATLSGTYLVSLRPQEDAYRIGTQQAWLVSITDATHQPFIPSALYFEGSMPGHGHGLPSQPSFTQHLGGGEFLLEGVLLNMPGAWRFVVSITGPSGPDSAQFDINVQPGGGREVEGNWSPTELALIDSLQLNHLSKPVDASNRYLNDPLAQALGEQLFHDTRLSASGEVSCATCHQPAKAYADGRKLAFGSATTKRHAPTLLGAAQSRWFYWDGRRDSLWSQALTPIETRGEMDNTRTDAVRFILSNSDYAAQYSAITGERPLLEDDMRFPPAAGPYGTQAGRNFWHRMTAADQGLINRTFANIGKFIASFEATLQFSPSQFDAWIAGNGKLSPAETAGLRLFLDINKTQCLRCHNGPLFTNHGFHNIATSVDATGAHDFGRMLGLQAALVDPFNCTGEFSDATPEQCTTLRFARRQDMNEFLDGAFKVPSLRGLTSSAPYFHDGRISTLSQAVDHYRSGQGKVGPQGEVPGIAISDEERDQLVAFLLTLS
jgi:cytochrome c peroxidase